MTLTQRPDPNRRRRSAVAAIVLATLAPCLPTTHPASAGSKGAFPAPDRKALEQTLAKAFRALPVPSKKFREDRTSGTRTIEAGTSTRAVATRTAAEARQIRVYERRIGTGEDAEVVGLEIRVYVNQERSLPEPLGSEGGTLETFTHDGLPGMRVVLAGATSGRVALPLSPEEEQDALTVLRLHVGAADIEPYLIEVAQGRRPDTTPWDSHPARRASEVRTIVVEFQGPRGEVERLVKATSAAPLRALLTP